mmetsp:Transcript_31480/g.51319  ORF Transcript_31480/g.51319 Transcript_31480/m.51319 type:complete len:225 (+) Transcript_31480:357-1031(+)
MIGCKEKKSTIKCCSCFWIILVLVVQRVDRVFRVGVGVMVGHFFPSRQLSWAELFLPGRRRRQAAPLGQVGLEGAQRELRLLRRRAQVGGVVEGLARDQPVRLQEHRAAAPAGAHGLPPGLLLHAELVELLRARLALPPAGDAVGVQLGLEGRLGPGHVLQQLRALPFLACVEVEPLVHRQLLLGGGAGQKFLGVVDLRGKGQALDRLLVQSGLFLLSVLTMLV